MVLVCDVFRHEIELLTSKVDFTPSVHFFEMGFVENPDKLLVTIQQFMGDMEKRANKKRVFFESEPRCFAEEAEFAYRECEGSYTYLSTLLQGAGLISETRFLYIPSGNSVLLNGEGKLEAVQQ